MYFDRQVAPHDALDPLPVLSVGPEASKDEMLQYSTDMARGLNDVDISRCLDDVNIAQNLWFADSFILTGGTISGVTSTRDLNRHTYKDVVLIEAQTAGFQRSPFTNRILRDQVWLGSTNSDYAGATEGVEVATLFLPFDILGYDPSRHQEEYNLALNSSVGKVISAALSDTISRMPYTPSQDVPAMIGQVTNLVRDLILGNRSYVNRASINRARRLAMDAYIEDNLDALTTGAAKHLMREFNLSRPTLYRIFESDGGVEAYVTRRRLYRALMSLKNTKPRRGAVWRIAEGHGFQDAGNFSRAFLSEFGFRPSEILGVRETAIGN